METFVAGVLSDKQAVEQVYKRLRAIGIQRSDISILFPARQMPSVDGESGWVTAVKTGATSGIVIGGLVGGLLGFGAFVIPGLEIFDEPILSILIGAAAGGMLGGIAGWLSRLATPKRVGTGSEEDSQVAGVLFAVYHCNEALKGRVEKILKECGAQAILPR